MTQIPRVVLRGIRDRVPASPTGYLLGSEPTLGTSPGPVKLLPRSLFLTPAQGAAQNQNMNPPKIIAWVEGLISDNELLGQVITTKNLSWQGSTFVSNAGVAASSTAIFNITYIVSGVPTLFATVTFAAGSNTGTMAFLPSASVLVPAGASIAVNGPSPADTTLANVGFSFTGQGS